MKKINWKKTLPWTLSLFVMVLLVAYTVVIAAAPSFTVADEKRWYTGARIKISESSQVDYNEFTTAANYSLGCAVVDNPTRGVQIFVPTKVVGEWNAFGANSPTGVGIYNCPDNGICGTANGTNILNNPSTGTERCQAGTYVSTDSVGSDGTYNWRCDGLHGGTNATCSANRIINGACGSADGTTVGTAPSGGDLCNEGTPSPDPASGPSGSTYTWSCNGANTGSNDSCSATHQSTGPYTLGPWGGCSTSCGTGTQTRTVTCNFDTCTGESNSSQACDAGSTTCGWTGYGSYGSCSTSCGNGTKYRTRTCTTGAPGSAHCAGSDTQGTSCSAGASDCGWGSYGSWGACSNSCGSGTQYRYRSCNVSGYCSGSNSQSQSCSSTSGCAGCLLYRPYSWPVQSGSTGGGSCVESNSGNTNMSHGQTINMSSTKCTSNPGSYSCDGQASVYCNNGTKQFTNISCHGTAGGIN